MDLALILSMFFDDAVQFAHLFSVEFVHSFWQSLSSFVSRGPKNFLSGEPRTISAWRGMVIPLSQDIVSKNSKTSQLTNLGSPLVSTKLMFLHPT